MTMKKLTVLLMTLAMAVLLTACGSDPAPQKTTSSGSGVVGAAEKAPEMPTAKVGGKTLVVYYSATGRTRTAAEAIAAATQGALFELVPQQPYTEADLDYNNKDSRVSREHEDAAGRHVALVKDTPDNFAVYDMVFIGYPIWWGSAAWPVDDFVKHNDFSGKTVIPFATSHSSPLGASGRNLAAMAGTGTWQEGECFDQSMTKEKVTDWVKSLK